MKIKEFFCKKMQKFVTCFCWLCALLINQIHFRLTMSDFQHYNNIARLITGEIRDELSNDEIQQLMAWVDECPENEQLYLRIKNSTNFKLRNVDYQDFDVSLGWETVSTLIEKKRKLIVFNRILRYAAAIVLPLLIAGGVYFAGNLTNQNETIAQVNEIRPGSTKAILILNDGKTVLLDSANFLSIKENDGTLIEKSEGKLKYTNSLNEVAGKQMFNTLYIPKGGEYNLILADGTRVYLNSMSSFKYPVAFLGKYREVELSGEAYFEVVKDASRPFVVKTSVLSIEVLGTSFNLNAYENTEKIVTTLVDGIVKINSYATNESRVLTPDDKAIFHIKDGQIDINKVDVNLYTAWKDGNITFYDSRLEDIMTILSRWYSSKVFYKGASVKELRFSGNLNRYRDISQILDIVRSTGRVNIDINGNTIIFSEIN